MLSAVSRVLDVITSVLGVVAGPGVLFHVVGVVTIALSVAAITLLVRLNPRRALRRAATGA